MNESPQAQQGVSKCMSCTHCQVFSGYNDKILRIDKPTVEPTCSFKLAYRPAVS